MAGPAGRYSGDAGNRRFRCKTVTEEAMDCVVAGMYLMTECNRLNRRAVPEIQRQEIHQCHSGGNNNRSCNQSGNEP